MEHGVVFLLLCSYADSGPLVQKRRTKFDVSYVRISVPYAGNATITVFCENLGNFTFHKETFSICSGYANVTTCSTVVQPTRCVEHGNCDAFKMWQSSVISGFLLFYLYLEAHNYGNDKNNLYDEAAEVTIVTDLSFFSCTSKFCSAALYFMTVFTARCYVSAVLAMGLCPSVSVSVSVCHKSEFY